MPARFVSSIPPNSPSPSPDDDVYLSSILPATPPALLTVPPSCLSSMKSRMMSTARFSASTCTSWTRAASPSAPPRAYATMGRWWRR